MISFERRNAGAAQGRLGTRTGGIEASVVQGGEGLRRLEGDWNALFADLPDPSPCASHAWASAWWAAFGEKAAGLFVVVVREAGKPVGIVPLFETRAPGALRLRQLRALGFLEHADGPDMTEEPILLAREGREAEVLRETVRALRSYRGRWDAVTLRMASPCLRALAGRLAVRPGSDYAHLPASWEGYRKRLGKSMRDNLAYYPRLLTRDGHNWSVRVVRSPDAQAAGRRLVELHRDRAQSARGPKHSNHISGPAQEAFLGELLTRHPEAFVAELVVGGEVVASQAFVGGGNQLMVYYSGYQEAWSKYSPIFVIDSVVFKSALESGVRRLDFLRGMAPWKARWGAVAGPRLCRTTLVAPHPASQLRYALHATRQAWRRHVVLRAPILLSRIQARLSALRKGLDRCRGLLVPLVPHVHRLAPRVHWAMVQVPIHHR